MDKNTTLYLSGPMTGYANENRQAFEDAEHRLRSLGYHVINPNGLAEPSADCETDAQRWAAYLARDIHFLVTMKDTGIAVVLLAGWRNSKGACLEAAVAEKFGIPVYNYGQVLLEINHGKRPC